LAREARRSSPRHLRRPAPHAPTHRVLCETFATFALNLGSIANMTGKDKGSGRGAVRVRVKRTGKRTASSRRWLERQLNDPYVREAKVKGYRSRAAFKLVELDRKFRFLAKGARVLDLGAAPGGWSQVAAARAGESGRVVAADILGVEPLAGVVTLEADLLAPGASATLKEALGGPADLVLSDMAAPTTGHRATDHLRTVALFEAALDVAEEVLKPGGAFVGKVFQGGATGALLTRIKQSFAQVKHVKPPASRAESIELYVVALGFRRQASGIRDQKKTSDT
jgi:23S rRNA (uridine2552-2'-O)-methyltransferase